MRNCTVVFVAAFLCSSGLVAQTVSPADLGVSLTSPELVQASLQKKQRAPKLAVAINAKTTGNQAVMLGQAASLATGRYDVFYGSKLSPGVTESFNAGFAKANSVPAHIAVIYQNVADSPVFLTLAAARIPNNGVLITNHDVNRGFFQNGLFRSVNFAYVGKSMASKQALTDAVRHGDIQTGIVLGSLSSAERQQLNYLRFNFQGYHLEAFARSMGALDRLATISPPIKQAFHVWHQAKAKATLASPVSAVAQQQQTPAAALAPAAPANAEANDSYIAVGSNGQEVSYANVPDESMNQLIAASTTDFPPS